MLSAIRKHTGSWGLKVLYFIVAITFLGGFGGIFAAVRGCGSGLSEGTVAMVNHNAISLNNFNRAYRNTINAYQKEQKITLTRDEITKLNIPEQVLSSLISNEVAKEKSRSIGFIVTNVELREEIAHIQAFQNKEHQFDPRLYYAVLREQNILPSEFQNDIKEEILILKLKKIFYDGTFLQNSEYNILNKISKQPLENPADMLNNFSQLRYAIAQSSYNTWLKGVTAEANIEQNKAILSSLTQSKE